MTLNQAIKARRSVRKYKKGITIPREHIERMLEAAMLAPSSRNSRPWNFIVVEGEEMLSKIADVHPYAQMARNASLAIVVCAREDRSPLGDPVYPCDCGAAVQNILLTATDLGYGSVWCGVYPQADRITALKKLLDIKNLPFALLVIGVPDESPAQKGFFDPGLVRYIK